MNSHSSSAAASFQALVENTEPGTDNAQHVSTILSALSPSTQYLLGLDVQALQVQLNKCPDCPYDFPTEEALLNAGSAF